MRTTTILTILTTLIGSINAFTPVSPLSSTTTAATTPSITHRTPFLPTHTITNNPHHHNSNTPRSPSTHLHSLFGLGGPEIAIILVAAAFVLGPQKLAELGKDAGKIAGELKEVPKEFQKGLEEGEMEAQATKKKIIGEAKEDTETTSE